MRITAQLIDALTGTHLWADRFDGALDDIFELQDGVASGVVGPVEPRLRQSEIERAIASQSRASMPMTSICVRWRCETPTPTKACARPLRY